MTAAKRRRSVPTSPIAANEFTALHEGKTPRGTVLETIRPFVGPKRILGRCTEIQYLKDVTDGTYPYHHPFAEHAQPTVFTDRTGRIGFYRGRYVVTYRGIEDRTRSEIEDERLPGRATRLITLGRVQFLKYKWEDEDGSVKTEEIRFEAHEAPILSHDQRGDLHLTGGRLLKETTMNAGFGQGKKRTRKNPSRASGGRDMSMMSRAKRLLVSGIAVGLGATAVVIGTTKLFAKYTWSAGAKAAAKIGTGIALAMIAGMVLPSVPALAAGLAVGGVVAGSMDLYVAYILPRLSSSAPNAGAYPHLPAGSIPSGYGAYTGANCGANG